MPKYDRDQHDALMRQWNNLYESEKEELIKNFSNDQNTIANQVKRLLENKNTCPHCGKPINE